MQMGNLSEHLRWKTASSPMPRSTRDIVSRIRLTERDEECGTICRGSRARPRWAGIRSENYHDCLVFRSYQKMERKGKKLEKKEESKSVSEWYIGSAYEGLIDITRILSSRLQTNIFSSQHCTAKKKYSTPPSSEPQKIQLIQAKIKPRD